MAVVESTVEVGPAGIVFRHDSSSFRWFESIKGVMASAGQFNDRVIAVQFLEFAAFLYLAIPIGFLAKHES